MGRVLRPSVIVPINQTVIVLRHMNLVHAKILLMVTTIDVRNVFCHHVSAKEEVLAVDLMAMHQEHAVEQEVTESCVNLALVT